MKLPKPDGGGSFTPVPDGSWPAICYRVIDLGTQETTFKGETKEQRKVLLSFELKDEELMIEKDGKSLPMTLHQRYTFSMFERAQLRKHLEAWRGKGFTDDDFDGPNAFQMERLLGAPCLLSVVNKETNGKTYSNIGGISKLPKQMSAGKLVNDTVFLSLEPDEFRREVFDALPDRLKETIMDSPEYQKIAHGGGSRNAYQERALQDDEVPF